MKRSLYIIVTLALIAVFAVPSLAGECKEKNYGFKFNGFLKTDLIYDNARAYPGNYALYVPAFGDDDNNSFYMTARESRLGFDFWWKEECFKTSAYIEFDFQNTGGGENKAGPMLRHAYFKFGKGRWSILAGQTWDVISPLNPATANYSVLWYQGNIGYRRPQLRFTTWTELGDEAKMKFDVALSRNLASDLDIDRGISLDGDGAGIDDGVDSGLPALQARLGYASTLGDEGKFGIGVSGHVSRETYGSEDSISVNSWSFNTDVALSFTKKIALKGEFFYGKNLAQYLGGIGQRFNPVNEALPSMGGWAMLSLKPKCSVTLNLGYSVDDPDDEEWTCPDDGNGYTLRDSNKEMFGNIFLGLSEHVTAIFEVAYMKTEYLTRMNDGTDITDESEDFDDVRVQFALKCAIK